MHLYAKQICTNMHKICKYVQFICKKYAQNMHLYHYMCKYVRIICKNMNKICKYYHVYAKICTKYVFICINVK